MNMKEEQNNFKTNKIQFVLSSHLLSATPDEVRFPIPPKEKQEIKSR